jgi:hypothetical protein
LILTVKNEYEYPDPSEILEAAEAEPPKLNLRHYYSAMGTLRSKGFSFADVAKWLSEKLGTKITRSQVAYVLTTPVEVLDAEAQDEAMEREADEMSEEMGTGEAIISINGKKIEE